MKVVTIFVCIFTVISATPLEEGIKQEDVATSSPAIVGQELSEHVFEEMEGLSPEHSMKEEEDQAESSNNRKKKSATTTFCVEVKPSNPYQKPYELCESGNEIYAVPAAEVHYNAPAAQPQPQQAPAVPAATYGPPQKAYAAVAPSNGYVQSASIHNTAYKAASKGYESKKYRTSDDMMMEENSEEEDEGANAHMRSYSYGGSGYGGSGYGGYSSDLVKFIGAEGKLKKKGHDHGHSGVVITCQPNLAGYASPLHPPAPVGYGGHGGYGGVYRNSNQREMSTIQSKTAEDSVLEKRYGYGHRNGGYGFAVTPNRGSSVAYTSYSASLPTYSAPVPTYPAPAPPYPGPAPPSYPVPSPSYSAPSYSAPAPGPTYGAPAPPQTYSVPVPSYGVPAHQPMGPAPAASAQTSYHSYAASAVPVGPAAPSQGPAGFGPPFKQQKVIQSYAASSYSPPGTYRNSETEDKVGTPAESDPNMNARNMETMEKMTEERAPMWNHEMRSSDQKEDVEKKA